MMGRNPRRRASGVALVEVLVAMLVVSVGVLAMAGLLATASRYGKTSEYRAVATLLAADIADRIRANKAAMTDAGVGDVEAYNITGDYSTWSEEPPDPEGCDATECTPDLLAARDLAEWSQSVYASLPGGAAYVAVTEVGAGVGTGRNFAADVWIAWLDPDADSGAPTAGSECPPGFQELEPQPRCAFFRVGL